MDVVNLSRLSAESDTLLVALHVLDSNFARVCLLESNQAFPVLVLRRGNLNRGAVRSPPDILNLGTTVYELLGVEGPLVTAVDRRIVALPEYV